MVLWSHCVEANVHVHLLNIPSSRLNSVLTAYSKDSDRRHWILYSNRYHY